MSKLNLINLAKDELSKEEAQKLKGGFTSIISPLDPCVCSAHNDEHWAYWRPD